MTDNSSKIILDLCGGTGAWSHPYREAGYDVRLITLPKYDVLTYEPPESVYGILAAPPCTEFSIAKNGSHRHRDLGLGMETVRACFEIIWKCRIHSKLSFWAMENPRGFLRQFLGRPAITFDPWQYGDEWTKKNGPVGVFQNAEADRYGTTGRHDKTLCQWEKQCFLLDDLQRPHPGLVLRAETGPGSAQSHYPTGICPGVLQSQ